jgi:hypothetical protein
MRDFDDVSPNLQSVREGRELGVTDPGQRIADLKAAGFVSQDGTTLTELGDAVLHAWERYGVASNAIGDELSRLLLMALEARRLGDANFSGFYDYWHDLRTHFDPLLLIHNWDALYAINYLDFSRHGFAPGSVYRDEKIPITEIEFDLAEYARDTAAGEKAIKGGERIEKAIGGKIPRGRHRATFCMALEITIRGRTSVPAMLERFGAPDKPRTWTPFNNTQKDKIFMILDDYGQPAEQLMVPTQQPVVKIGLTLPANIDFTKVIISPPTSTERKSSDAVSGGGTGVKKIDYKQKAETNEAVGDLGEEFAVAYERWRLRDHPDLLKKLRHVSKEDDTLGYDIESFELDGTPRFLEVKATLGPMESRFFLTAAELACAEKKTGLYMILRVAQLSSNPKCCEVRYPFTDALVLTPATYNVTFKSSGPADPDEEGPAS